MPNKTFNARVQMKRDTSANWTSNNPVLLYGEIIIVDTDAGEVRFKVGNGTSTYTQLPYTDEAIISRMLSLSGGIMAGNINMNGNVVTGLGAPVNATDAVRQQDLEVLSDEIDGIIAGTSPITLPIASDVRLGGVKVGEGVEIAEDGTISVDDQLPTGGTQGQILTQGTNGPEWADAPDPLPAGGTTGQVLTKTASGQEWADGGMTQDAADARYLKLSGGTMSGTLTFDPTGANKGTLSFTVEVPSQNLQNRSFTYTADSGLDVNGVAVHGLPDPTNDTDAANKAYVDSKAPTGQTVTLTSSGWTSTTGGFQQVVSVTGVTTDPDQIIWVDVSQSGTDLAADKALNDAWGAGPGQLKPKQQSGALQFFSIEKPTVNIPVDVVVSG